MRRCREFLAAFSGIGAAWVFAAGCAGYQLGSVQPEAFRHIHTVAVPTFRNETLEPRFAVIATNAVIEEMQRDGTYQVESASAADGRLEGTIKQIKRRQVRSTRQDTLASLEMEFSVEVEYVFRDMRSYGILAEGEVEASSHQFLDPNFQLSEREALPIAAERLATELVSRISEGW
jgi:hypothetical protein